MKTNEMMSLYDYLGHAAGNQLGKEVALAAQSLNVPVKMRQVSNSAYTGLVCLYPKDFLSTYFKYKVKDLV
jgi:hypothetical protein